MPFLAAEACDLSGIVAIMPLDGGGVKLYN